MANIKIQLGNYSYTNTQKDYVYQDINSDFNINSNATDLLPNQDLMAIFSSLKNIFDYTPGERILKPNFGLNLRGLLYEPMNEHTANSIGMCIYNAINTWEPRISIINIEISPNVEDHTYYVVVKFKATQLQINEEQQFTYNLRQIV